MGPIGLMCFDRLAAIRSDRPPSSYILAPGSWFFPTVASNRNIIISLCMAPNADLAVDSIEWYNLHAESVVDRHESIRATDANAWLRKDLPKSPALVLDVGAGSGRDAAWLRSLGHKVIAVEPCPEMAAHARRLGRCHDIEWIDDRLPELAKVSSRNSRFDFILANAMWMHLAPDERAPAIASLIGLLSPGGKLAIAFSEGTPDATGPFFECPGEEILDIALNEGALLVKFRKKLPALMAPPSVQILLRQPN
jgi:SAM-dependent methyltransferase